MGKKRENGTKGSGLSPEAVRVDPRVFESSTAEMIRRVREKGFDANM